MAFMMPVVKNDWDIYNSQRSRRISEGPEKSALGGRVRKVSESRSEGPALGPSLGPRAALSPHRSAPTMRSLSYCRAPPSRASLRGPDLRKSSASPPAQEGDKFHNRLVDKLKRAFGRDSRQDERSSWGNPPCFCAGPARGPPRGGRAAACACPTCDRADRGEPGHPPEEGHWYKQCNSITSRHSFGSLLTACLFSSNLRFLRGCKL